MQPLPGLLTDENAMSPAVGITLLVAITVALATVVGVTFVGFSPGLQSFDAPSDRSSLGGSGGEQRLSPPRVAISVRADPGDDGTFSGSGNGGLCTGDTYEDDDRIDIEFVSGDSVEKRNIDFLVGPSTASMASCAGGDTGLDYLTTVPEQITAGTSITIAEAQGNNAIRSGATVRVVWRPEGVGESYTLHRSTIGE
jgi:hypothetical protein